MLKQKEIVQKRDRVTKSLNIKCFLSVNGNAIDATQTGEKYSLNV